MDESSFKSIRNGTIASVIAGAILMSVPVLRGYVFSFLKLLWSGIVWCWNALTATYSFPGWACLITLLFAFVGIRKIYKVIKGEAAKPEYTSYVEDVIYGAKWRWQWLGQRLSNLWCYCPRCDATLVYDDSSCRSIYSDIRKTDFICENCGSRVVATINGGNKDYAISAAEREILRRIRTGEYKKHQ
jgi:hypothetical protein